MLIINPLLLSRTRVIVLYWRNLTEFFLFVKVLFALVLECGAKR